MEFGGLAKYTNIIFKTNNKKYNDEQNISLDDVSSITNYSYC